MKSLAQLIGGEKKKKKWFEKREFLSDDLKERYELLHSSKKRYKRLKVQPVAVNHQWQMDLADLKYLERYNSGLRYLLIVIDV